MPSCRMVAGCSALLTVVISLTLVYSGNAQQNDNSSCAAIVKVNPTWPSDNTTSTHSAMIECDLEYLGGGSALPVGTYDVVISNPTYTKAMNATGWTVTNSDNGNIAGTIALDSPMQLFNRWPMTVTVEGTHQEAFYPSYVSFGGAQCYLQQA